MSVYKPYCKSEDTKSFAETIFDSIRYQEEDYLFKESDLQDLIRICREKEVSIIYEVTKDQKGEFDYAHIIPVRFFSDLGHEAMQLERSKVPKNLPYRVLRPKYR